MKPTRHEGRPSVRHNQVLTPTNRCNIKLPARILRISKRQAASQGITRLVKEARPSRASCRFCFRTAPQAVPEELLVWLRKSDHRVLLTDSVSELLNILIAKIRQSWVCAQKSLLTTIRGNVHCYAALRIVVADSQLYRLAAMVLRRYEVLKNI